MKKLKLELNKKKIKNLSKDVKNVPAEMTPQVAGGYMNPPKTMFCAETAAGCYIYD